MKLKILSIILISLFLVCPIFAETVCIERKTLEALTTQLSESTNLLKEARDTIKEKEARIEKIEKSLTKVNKSLLDSTKLLEEAKQRIINDQEEIKRLRNLLKQTIAGLADDKFFRAGVLFTYPYGGQFSVVGDIPRIPISIFGNFGISQMDTSIKIIVGVGIGFRF